MQYRKMGCTGVEVSALGYGCMRFPTVGEEKAVDEAEAIRLLRRAIDNGVNYVDTAYFYHGGNSEIIVGKALEDGYREKVSIATKLPIESIGCEEDVEKIFNDQLKKLRTDHIDFYLLHAANADGWKNKVEKFNIIPKIEKLKAEGKIRHFGFSFHDDLPVFKMIIDSYPGFEFCQIQYNYVDTDYQAGTEGLEYAASKGLGVIIMEPLLGGRLAIPPEAVASALSDKKSPIEWAFDYLWNRPEVSLVLSGMGSEQMVDDNIEYASRSSVGMLSEEELSMLAEAKKKYDSMLLIPCTGCEYCMPCPNGVEIPRIFAAYNRISDINRRGIKEIFPDIDDNARLCAGCGSCEQKCPQQLDIIKKLKAVRDKF